VLILADVVFIPAPFVLAHDVIMIAIAATAHNIDNDFFSFIFHLADYNIERSGRYYQYFVSITSYAF
jgi:hypothetical protein